MPFVIEAQKNNRLSVQFELPFCMCMHLYVHSCLCVSAFSFSSYFLGELEKCLAEPERLAQLFIKHVSISHTHTQTYIIGSVCALFFVFGARVNKAKKTCGAPVYSTPYPLLSPLPVSLIPLSCYVSDQPVFSKQRTQQTHTRANGTLAEFPSESDCLGNTRGKNIQNRD